MNVEAVLYGVGFIGALIGKVAIRKGIEIKGAIDIDPRKIGKDLGEVIGIGEKIGVRISKDPEEVLSKAKPDVVFHATGSFLDKVYPQIVKIIKHNAKVISTCETLAYPYYRYPELAELIDIYAKAHNSSVLSCGVNPGFIMDLLPSIMTLSLIDIKSIKITRSLNAAKRRFSFQKKIGLGLKPEEWREMLNQRIISGHVGYAESICLIASMLGIKLERIEERQEPILAERDYSTRYFKIKEGNVVGIKGVGKGYCKEGIDIEINLIASVSAEDYEEITILGEPTTRWRSNGTPGDLATAAVVVNVVPNILEAQPGLLTIKDIKVPSWKNRLYVVSTS